MNSTCNDLRNKYQKVPRQHVLPLIGVLDPSPRPGKCTARMAILEIKCLLNGFVISEKRTGVKAKRNVFNFFEIVF